MSTSASAAVTITHDPDLHAADRSGRMQPKGARLILKTPFGMKDRVKKLPGSLFADQARGQNGTYAKIWHVPATVETAGAIQRMLERYETPAQICEHALRLMARAEQSEQAQEHKNATSLPEIPGHYCTCPQGPKTTDDQGDDTQGMCDRCNTPIGSWLHQRQGYHWARPREGAGLIMDMGTGKSKDAIALAEGWNVQRMIVCAPPRAVKVWPKQFRLHAVRDWVVVNHGGRRRDGKLRGVSAGVKASMRDRVTAAEHGLQEAERTGRPFCLVVNYEAAYQEPLRTFLLETLPERFGGRWDLAAADESHKIKSPGGKWSRFMERLSHVADRRLALTGTMMPHDELDVYAQCRFIDPGIFGTSYSRFKARYFRWGGFEGRQLERDEAGSPFITPAAEIEFMQKLSSCTFVVESDDVLDLPKQIDQPPIVFSLGEQGRRHYREILEDWSTQVGDADVDDPLQAANVLSQMVRLAQVTSGHLPLLDSAGDIQEIVTIGEEKARALEDLIDGVPTDEPIVVFARFRHDLEQIERVAEKLGRRYGEISGRRQDGLTEDATMNPSIDLCGVQLQAGGVGIDLTRARYGIYYSLDFNLGDFDQSRKRIHRPGQRRETFYYYLVAEGTIDQVILHALRSRNDVVRGVLRAVKTGDFDPEGWDE